MKNASPKKSSFLRTNRVRIFLTLFIAAAFGITGWYYFGGSSGVSFAQRSGRSAPQAAETPGGISSQARRQISSLAAEKRSRTPVQKKIDSRLLYQMKMSRGQPIAEGIASIDTGIAVDDKGLVAVDITAQVSDELTSYLKKLGSEIVASYPRYRSITANVPIAMLEDIAARPGVIFIMPKQEGMTNSEPATRPVPPMFSSITSPVMPFSSTIPNASERAERFANVRKFLSDTMPKIKRSHDQLAGSVTSESDTTHRVGLARELSGFDGTGIKVGVMSNGVNTLADRQATGDLPVVNILPGQAGSGDEGTAMLELVHDAVPGATLYYATASGSFAGFAQNIRDLRSAGCDIIVDDYSYFYETPFQDGQDPSVTASTNGGVIIQAVNDVTVGELGGAFYFSSAANSGNKNDGTAGAWEGDFVSGGVATGPLESSGLLHDFGGSNVYDVLTLGGRVILKWSDPLGASTNDYDLYALNAAGTTVTAASTNVQSGTQDPLEDVGTRVAGERIVIAKFLGENRFLHLNTNRGRLSISTSGVTYGHNSGRNTISVAATPSGPAIYSVSVGPYPNAHSSADAVEIFSSDGPRRIFYNADSTPLTPGDVSSTGGELLQKPDITAADGETTTTPGFIPFFGTSAAAPQAAGMMALLKQAAPGATRAELYDAMTDTAIDIEDPGVDRDSGAGIFMPIPAMHQLGVEGDAYIDKGVVTTTEYRGNHNASIEPGETWHIAIQLQNAGLSDATGISATLSSSDPNITVVAPASAVYPDLSAANGSSNGSTPFTIELGEGFECGKIVNLVLTVTYAGGTRDIPVPIQTGRPSHVETGLDETPPPDGPAYTAATGTQTGRLNRTGVISRCSEPKPTPVLQDSTAGRRYDAYTYTASADGCVTVTIVPSDPSAFYSAAYNGTYNPTNIRENYIADYGVTTPGTLIYSFNVTAGQQFVVVVHEVNPGGAAGDSYDLSVSGPIMLACAVNASVSGRATTEDGIPINNALVIVVDNDNIFHSARTNTFGYYHVDYVPTGENLVVIGGAKGYTFPPVSVDVHGDMTGVNIIGH
jgi:hypothetical protein